jgi:alkylated DNA nucleotide flippase Atl1
MTTQDYIHNIIQVIPKGSVAYYGQIAEILEASHQIIMRGQIVGWTMSAMKKNPKYNDSNWQRVVAKTGQIVTYKLGLIGNLQADLLAKEGVVLVNGIIPMNTYCMETSKLLALYQVTQ